MAVKEEKKTCVRHTAGLGDVLPLLNSAGEDERIVLEGNILKALEAAFNESSDQLVLHLKECKAHRLGHLHKEAIKAFMKNNELVNEYVASFFAWIVDLLPISFIEIFFEEEDAVCKYYRRVFTKLYRSYRVTESRLSVEEHDPDTLRNITKPKITELAKYPGAIAYLVRNLMHMNEEERLFLITKHLKRGDLEYYLNMLIDSSQNPEKYMMHLHDYLNNRAPGERSSKYSVFMNVYSFIKKNGHRVVEDVTAVQRVFDDYSVKELLKSDIGTIFFAQTISHVAEYAGCVGKCRDIVHEALESNVSRDVSKILWNTLVMDRNTFIECIDKFKVFEDEDLGRILLYGNRGGEGYGPSICRSIAYGDGIYRKEAIEYVVESFSARDIMDVLLRQDSDERGFLLECIYRKALVAEFDFRVFEIEDEVWVDKIFDEIFKTLDCNIYDTLNEKRPELAFDYCFRHKDLRRRYFEKIDKKNCTIEEGICIHKILKCELEQTKDLGDVCRSYAEAVYGDNEGGNEVYMISTLVDPVFTGGVVEFIYLLTLIRPDDAKYYVCEYFDEVCRIGANSLDEKGISGDIDHSEVLSLNDLSLLCLVPLHQMIGTIFSTHLKNKYLVYTVMDSLLGFISKSTQHLRLTILRNMDSSSVTPHHIVRFIDTLTPLLHDSNIQICNESKRLLMEIPVTTPELACLKSQMVQSIVDKMYARSFFGAVRGLQFSHYLCFNGLNMLVQTLTMHIKGLKEDVFSIINSLQFIAHPSDLELVFPVIFESLSLFVIENAFYLDECCSAASSLMKFGRNVSFDKLLGNMGHSLRVNKFLVKCLKACDDRVVEGVINRLIREGSCSMDNPRGQDHQLLAHIEPFFLAYAPELPVFRKYIPVFEPLLKSLFLSSDMAKQEIASKAFESMEVLEFLMFCCIVGQWKTRLLCIELFDKKGAEDNRVLAMLFILRNDTHSAIRKRALEIWKDRVENTNSALRNIHGTVLGCLGYKGSTSSFHDAIMGTLNDLIGKYDKYIEKYLRDAINVAHPEDINTDMFNPLGLDESEEGLKITTRKEVIETILIECVKSGKHLDLAFDFGTRNSSISLFRHLLQIPLYREKAIEVVGNRIDDPAISDLFVGDSQLGSDLFKMTRKTFLFKFLRNSDKISLLEAMLSEEKPNDGRVGELLGYMKSSEKLEQLLLASDPLYTSMFYGSGEKLDDHGHQKELFLRAFNILDHQELKPLISLGYLNLLLDVSYKNIKDPRSLIEVLCTSNSLRALERLGDIVSNIELGDSLFALSGHLLRNYLFYEKRETVLPSLGLLYRKYRDKLGAFRLTLERLLDDTAQL
ncbi:similarity to GCN1-LIKE TRANSLATIONAL ACTIVATOR [Encephalitozoon cuniculi GB-M1]|uniref:Similarity to GCN1-LIKE TRANSLATIONAL ACTIVATOR n=1 Tax=Encephalitozoon cuniculi (strain GB-M1) TaxID=284813 RepID=Q8SV50_ENCCU|nr:uncharacterized protein ECU07_0140 [Encephalitozoon cuniculi GB-M1]CAD25546.1 similarity to GCN1-LIKE TRANSLATIONAL ACTIVATOR [Encephalitozoon cuniculi GB-M1]